MADSFEQDEYVVKIFNSLSSILKCMGLNIFDVERPKKYKALFLSYFMFTSVFLYFCFGIIYIVQNYKHVSHSIESMVMVTTSVHVCAKMAHMHLASGSILKLKEDLMSNRLEIIETLKNKGLVDEFSKKILYAVWVSNSIYYLAGLMLLLLPVISKEEFKLPHRTTIPFMPHDEHPYYEINYAFHTYLTFIAGSSIGAFDSTFMVFITQGCIHMEALSTAVKQVGEQKTDEENTILLRDIYLSHVKCLKFIDELATTYSAALLCQLTTSLFVLCTALVVMSEMDGVLNPMSAFVLSCLVQLLAYCWFGTLLTTKCEELTLAIYDNKWYETSPPCQTALLIMIHQSQEPIIISAGGFSDLSLISFLAIIKAVYSYYAILEEMKE